MKVLVFDIGGTLMEYKNMPLSWLDYYKDAFRYVRDELKLNISDRDIDRSHDVMKSYNPRINPREKDVAPIAIFAEATMHWHGEFELKDVMEKFFESMHLTAFTYPETLDILKRLKAEGYIIAALTDIAIGMTDEMHKSYFPELMTFFDMYVSSESCGYRKPNPKGLKIIAEHFGAEPSEMLMIGDEEKDIATAKRFGCESVLVDRNDFGAYLGQDHTIIDLNELWNVLDRADCAASVRA